MIDGQKIKALRIKAGWSQEEFAKQAKVSQQLIAKIEKGKLRESRKLPQIAAAFDLKVEELLSGEISQSKTQSKYLTNDEQKLLDLYRSASRTGQKSIMGAAIGVTDRSAEYTVLRTSKSSKRSHPISEYHQQKAPKKSKRRLLG